MTTPAFGPAAATPRRLVKATIILEEPGGVGNMFVFDGGDDAAMLMAVDKQTDPDDPGAAGKVGWTLRLTRVTRNEAAEAKNRGQLNKAAKAAESVEEL
jgi:hypothetical protein